jgi:hypothetical protein
VEGRPLGVRGEAVALEKRALLPEQIENSDVDRALRLAEKVRRAEEGVAGKNVSVEVRQRLDRIAFAVRRGDREPEPQFAEPHRIRVPVDAVEGACDDPSDVGRPPEELLSAQDDVQGREEERTRSAGGIKDRDARERVVFAIHVQPGGHGMTRKRLRDRSRRVEGAAASAILGVHERFEDAAKHLGVDRRAARLRLHAELERTERVEHDAPQKVVRETNVRMPFFKPRRLKESAVQVGDRAEAPRSAAFLFQHIQAAEEERPQCADEILTSRRKVPFESRAEETTVAGEPAALLDEGEEQEPRKEEHRFGADRRPRFLRELERELRGRIPERRLKSP